MIDTVAVPDVRSPSVPVVGAGVGTLTRASGTALHVLADPEYILVRRNLLGTCTREEWAIPARRARAISAAWQRAISALRADDEEFVSVSPVTLYRDPISGTVDLADIRLPGDPTPRLITPLGRRVVASPADLWLRYRVERTSYARWAEGPFPHTLLEMAPAPTPDTDRDIQYLRNKNPALRALIDASLGPAEWAPHANDAARDDGLVDYRLRCVCRRRQIPRLVSKQGTGVSALILDGRSVPATDFERAETLSALDAALEAD